MAIVGGLVVLAVVAVVVVVVVLRASTGDQQSLTREVPVEVVSQRTVESGSTREYVDVELLRTAPGTAQVTRPAQRQRGRPVPRRRR